MLAFLKDNLSTVLVGLAVLLLLSAALWSMVAARRRARRSGSACAGGCACCPYAGRCAKTGSGEDASAER